jgi:hypothetical protein
MLLGVFLNQAMMHIMFEIERESWFGGTATI